jgi:hypothetical protein
MQPKSFGLSGKEIRPIDLFCGCVAAPENGSGLEQLAASQILDQAPVGGQEVVVGEIFEARPHHLGEDTVLQVAPEIADGEELQVDRPAMAIVVPDVGDLRPDLRLDAQLFV